MRSARGARCQLQGVTWHRLAREYGRYSLQMAATTTPMRII